MMLVERITLIVKIQCQNQVCAIHWYIYICESNYNSRRISSKRRHNNIQVVFKNCARSTDWISEMNRAQIDNAKDINIVMPMSNLIEYSDNYSRTSGILWQYFRDEPA